MTGTTISGGHVSGITLSNAEYNPAYIAGSGVINTTAGSAIYGASGTTWTVTSAGTLAASNGGGIKLAAGGDITNKAAGTITAFYGIDFAKNNTAGTVLNAGTVSGSSVGVDSYYDLLLNNTTNAQISGFYGVWVGGNFGAGGAGMITNAGTITGANFGVYLERGGTVTNQMGGQITAFGTAYSEGGVKASNQAPITVINDGTISATRDVSFPPVQRYHEAYGIAFLNAGGSVTNQVDGVIVGQSTNNYTSGAGLVSGGVATVVNAGTIEGKFSGSGMGISLIAGGVVTNLSSGLIESGGFDNRALIFGPRGETSTAVNYGTIDGGTDAAAIELDSLGEVDNKAGGTLTGVYGVNEEFGGGEGLHASTIAAVVDNAGLIHSYNKGVTVYGRPGAITNQTGGMLIARNGVVLVSGGSVVNEVGAEITAKYVGVVVYNGPGTVVNDGTMIGSTTVGVQGKYGAVVFAAGYDNLLVTDPGAVFTGLVRGGNALGASAVSTIELATGSGIGTITGFGTNISNFYGIDIDRGASWLIGGDTVGLGGTIAGFAPGDTIDLTGFVATGKSFSSNVLTLTGATTQTLNLPGSYVTSNFTIDPDGSGGTFITVACFAEGTRILTARGEMEVETLCVGDLVPTLGRLAPVRWIGRRRIDVRRHARPWVVWPVQIKADAFGAGVPHADLLVSPDHAMLVGENLIPARHLVNGVTVVQQAVDEIVYYHVELDRHEVLLVNGMTAESFLDTGNRVDFDDGDALAEDADRLIVA